MTPAAYRRAVLTVVAAIPPGRVMAYGSIAAYLAELSGRASPRLVGQIMARDSSGVPWQRVVRENGLPARGHEAKALRRLLADGTPVRGVRVDMARAAWSPDEPAAVLLARTGAG
ncbi:MAG TPA: MGMT family protein [Candidatus Acidoferrales bacterium]|nr:MGMT family protein [Candidatus Acidoferrales bacterium]